EPRDEPHPTHLDLMLRAPHGVLQLPVAVRLLPEMIGAPAVDHLVDRIFRDGAVLEEVVEVLARKLSIVFLHQGLPLLARDLAVADLVRAVRGGAPHPELYV